MLAKIIWCEARGEDLRGQILVGNVIMNRVNNKSFPNTIKDVIFAPNQFTPVTNGSYNIAKPTELNKEAVDNIMRGIDYSQGATYFRTKVGATPDSWHERALTKLFDHGCHRFYK